MAGAGAAAASSTSMALIAAGRGARAVLARCSRAVARAVLADGASGGSLLGDGSSDL
jgi:hypothetical protein